MKKTVARIFQPALRNVQYFERRRLALGIIGIIGFPLYYYVWHDIFPQPYENLPLRLLGSAFFLPLILSRYWPPAARRYLPHLWYLALLYALPFFFTFMLLKNQGSSVWVESMLVAVFAMVLLLDWASLIVHFAAGAGLAWLAFCLTTDTPTLVLSHAEGLPIVMFAVILGAAANYATEMVRTEQEHAMLATAGSIAHELRTPLLGITAGAGGLRHYLPILMEAYCLARKNKLPVPTIRTAHFAAMKGVLDRIEMEARHSNAIIDMLLVNTRLSSFDSGNFAECSMARCVETALQRYPFTEAERALVAWERGDFSFFGSELLTVHVIFNLIKNALRHIAKSGKGGITLRIETSAQGNRLFFRDTAAGISPEALPHIFTRFYTSASNGDGVLGVGIGLAFCRDVMHAFGGTIKCDSIAGEFTEFALTFPRP